MHGYELPSQDLIAMSKSLSPKQQNLSTRLGFNSRQTIRGIRIHQRPKTSPRLVTGRRKVRAGADHLVDARGDLNLPNRRTQKRKNQAPRNQSSCIVQYLYESLKFQQAPPLVQKVFLRFSAEGPECSVFAVVAYIMCLSWRLYKMGLAAFGLRLKGGYWIGLRWV